MSKEEAELIAKCEKGDIKSCELLYNRYSRAMYHTCLRILNNQADAEDILQDAFMEAFTSLEKLKNMEAFAGWLKRIIINKSLNYLKRQKKTWLELEAVDQDNLIEEEMPDEQAFQQKIEAITDALAQLPDKYRIVINLHVFEDMSFEDIAQLMEMPSGTVRSQYMRGRQKILGLIN